jgi:putative flippase GtrA
MENEVVDRMRDSKTADIMRANIVKIPLLSRANLAEITRFGIVGLSSVGFYYALLIGFVEWLGMQVLVSAVLAYLISMVWNYWRQRSWAFKSDRDHKSSIPGYIVTHAVGMGINTVALYIFAYYFEIYYLLAQVIATCAVAAWSYLSLKLWVFRVN